MAGNLEKISFNVTAISKAPIRHKLKFIYSVHMCSSPKLNIFAVVQTFLQPRNSNLASRMGRRPLAHGLLSPPAQNNLAQGPARNYPCSTAPKPAASSAPRPRDLSTKARKPFHIQALRSIKSQDFRRHALNAQPPKPKLALLNVRDRDGPIANVSWRKKNQPTVCTFVVLEKLRLPFAPCSDSALPRPKPYH